jgi:hypothetical protein
MNMAPQTARALEPEQERQQLIQEMIAEYGPDWSEQYRPRSFGCHGLLDRTSLAADIVERYVLSHTACVQNQDWFALAEKAVVALRELYQRIGQDHLSDDPEASGSA